MLTLGIAATGVLAQDPLKTLPNNYRLIFENQEVAVIRAHYGAHENIPVHDHTAFATVFVYLNSSGATRIDHEEGGKVESVVRPPTVEGAYRVAAGIAERHRIENLSDTSSEFLRVELKRVDLSGMKEPFRGKAPASLAASEDAVEFTAPGVEIERIVCVGTGTCAVKASAAPSLLIPFTAMTLRGGGGAEEKLVSGGVRWLPAGQGATVRREGAEAGHLLRILLPKGPQ